MTTTPDHSTKTHEAANDEARKPRPVTDELRALVQALHAEGLGRNAIARELEISAGSVTKICREAGLEFDRSLTAFAVRAQQLDQAAERALLAKKFLLVAHDSLDALEAPVVIGSFGGSDNVWNETLLDEPTISDKATLVKTAVVAAGKHVDLVKIDAARDQDTAISLIESLAGAITAQANALKEPSNAEPVQESGAARNE